MSDEIRPAGLPEPIQKDTFIYRAVVIVLGAAVLVALLGSLVLPWFGVDVPDGVQALGMAALVALAGILGKDNP